MINARCVAHDLRMIAPGPLERMCWRQFVAQLGDCKNSQFAPCSVIIIIVIVVIIIIIIIKIIYCLIFLLLGCSQDFFNNDRKIH